MSLEQTQRGKGDEELDWRFGTETIVLSILFGGVIAAAIAWTGRTHEVVLLAIFAGLAQVTSVIQRERSPRGS